MTFIMTIFIIAQIIFMSIAGIYFFRSLKGQDTTNSGFVKESNKKLDKLKEMKNISLSKPLTEKTRPKILTDIIGQENGVKALRQALCSSNPSHVIIYGPPGVGKTAAARLVLEEAKKIPKSPFKDFSKFIEIDATTLRFDERSIADPLIGSVHDPIYQGAGIYGGAGIPQPKEGAVSKAHGGVLFIDEIGELHPIQMNKLLKVLEDRAVFFTSSYYSEDNKNIPNFIHEIFKEGMPADFRLIGATTRSPEEIPPALRSRCTEIFFDDLKEDDIKRICKNAVMRTGFICREDVIDKVAEYAVNGRDAVNIVQSSISSAEMEGRSEIVLNDVDWVIESGHYMPKMKRKIKPIPQIGVVNGLAVSGNSGFLLTIEAKATKNKTKKGMINVTGIVSEEEIKSGNSNIKRKSNAMASVENAATLLEDICDVDLGEYDIHINFPGGSPVDGPSAGCAIFCALYSEIFKTPINNKVAMTGEISICGDVLPVGGVDLKVEGAKVAGAKIVFVPYENYKEKYTDTDIRVIGVRNIYQIIEMLFGSENIGKKQNESKSRTILNNILSAKNI